MIERLKNFLSVVYVLMVARNKEFYRDRSGMMWALFFPFLMVGAIGFAFSGGDQTIFTLGYYAPAQATVESLPLPGEKFIEQVHYTDLDTALQRVRSFQLDVLLSTDNPGVYWVNEDSPSSMALEQILVAKPGWSGMQRQPLTGREIRYVDWVIPGVLGMNLMFGSVFGIGYVIVRYRKNGVLKRMQATPVTPLQFLTSQVLSRMMVMVVICIILYAGCNLMIDFIMVGSYLDLIVVALLAIFSMITLALIVATRTTSEELAGGLLNLITFPMLLLSEVWFSLDNAPAWLKSFSQCLPLTHAVQAAREIMLNGTPLSELTYHVWTLVVMSIVFLVLGSLMFRWNEP